MKTFTKTHFKQFVNELSQGNRRYIPVQEEEVPKGFLSAMEISKTFGMNHRVCQKKISEYLMEGKLEVIMARRRISVVAVRKVPCYKFKKKSYEKSFKG